MTDTAKAIEHTRRRNFGMAAVELMPAQVFKYIYNNNTPDDTQLSRQRERDFTWKLTTRGLTVALPQAKDALRVTHIGDVPERRVRDKYTLPGVVEPKPGDHVVDVGAFIGEYSWQVVTHDGVGRVTAIEPDPRTEPLASYNTPDAVTVHGCAAAAETGRDQLYAAHDPSESGLLQPDTGPADTVPVSTCRLDMLLDDTPDLVKIEAEGAEPDVLRGLHYRPPEIAIDVSPEAGGESTGPACRSILTERGYQLQRKNNVLFAWLDQLEELADD